LLRARPDEVSFSTERLHRIAKYYADKVNDGKMAGTARHGKGAHFSAVGYADVGSQKKLQADSIFRPYSMTKPIVAEPRSEE
jgi:CubicO group peptidase (beta-lactamase class C family)